MTAEQTPQEDAHGIGRWTPHRVRMKDAAAERDWPSYFESAAGTPPRDTLTRAADLFEREGRLDVASARPLALDLGAGEGRDTVDLLRRGWRVLAIDSHPEARIRIEARLSDDLRSRLEIDIAAFGDRELPVVPLVNASYALPFCPPDRFEAVWAQIRQAVEPGGRFAGQFFGDRHGWASKPDRTHHTREQVEGLLAGWTIEHLDEEFGEGEPDWHVFHIVARAPGQPGD